jgi:hypothetical protein
VILVLTDGCSLAARSSQLVNDEAHAVAARVRSVMNIIVSLLKLLLEYDISEQ